LPSLPGSGSDDSGSGPGKLHAKAPHGHSLHHNDDNNVNNNNPDDDPLKIPGSFKQLMK